MSEITINDCEKCEQPPECIVGGGGLCIKDPDALYAALKSSQATVETLTGLMVELGQQVITATNGRGELDLSVVGALHLKDAFYACRDGDPAALAAALGVETENSNNKQTTKEK